MPAPPRGDRDSGMGLEEYRRATDNGASDRRHGQGLQASCVSMPMCMHMVATRVPMHVWLCTYLQRAPSGLVLFLLPQLASPWGLSATASPRT